jgi:excinuclease ABC subunit B
MRIKRKQIIERLVDLRYEREEFGFYRGTFRLRGDAIDIYPAYQDIAVRIELTFSGIKNISLINPVSGQTKERSLEKFILYPAKHYLTNPLHAKSVFAQIRKDLVKRVAKFKKEGKELEAKRLEQRVTYDLEMIEEVGYVKGIENYSRYFDGRRPGEAPFTLLDYFSEACGNNWLVIVDESHITFPQLRGMYAGDRSRKEVLVKHGFRLPAAFDNRPLTFDEFMRKIPNFIAMSATPNSWEINLAGQVVEQLLRPTGIPDPEVEIRPTKFEVKDVIKEIKKRAKKNQRTLVTTLTKRTAEDLASYLKEQGGIKVCYLHSDVKTLERSDILDDLRRGNYDCLVGINLLREGLDLPEVSLVAILDADKEGFLRSETTLIQTMGRAARHIEGKVILYADTITGSMRRALNEVGRRRKYQIKMNKKYKIEPKPIKKPIREKLIQDQLPTTKESVFDLLFHIDLEGLTPMEKKKLVKDLKKEMRIAAQDLNFELAAKIRDKIREIE